MATTILLIDDEDGFVQTMAKRLGKREIVVVKSYSGQEALDILSENNQIDVAVLDVKMPGMDGIETLKAIKQEFPLVEVIMLTGHATVESAIDGMKMGAFDYLMKPCDIDQLMTKIAEAKTKKLTHEEKIIEAQMREITSRQSWD
ncbi:response regulator [Desulfoplanes sp. PS50]